MFRAKLELSLKIRKFENGSFIGIHRVRAIYESDEACKRPRSQLNARLRTLIKLAACPLIADLLITGDGVAINQYRFHLS